MSAPSRSFARLRAALRSFPRQRRGSAAVEFAMVAPMFFALIFAIMETSLVFFAGQVLETGTQDTARLLLTQQAQNKGWGQADFKQSLCDRVSLLFECNGIYIDVQSYAPNAPIVISNPIDGAGNFTNNFVYQPPPQNSANTVVVRAFYQWPLYVTRLGYNIANIGSSGSNPRKLLAATTAFRVQ
jgi:Flp pilus assembly protein TadG